MAPPGWRKPLWPRVPANWESPPSTRRWLCALTGSPHRCWPGCIHPASTSGPRCWPMWRSRFRRCANSTSCWTRSRRTGRTATVTVKVDTGLNRNGVAAADYPSMLTALGRAVAEDAIRLRGLMSHMVYADQPDNPINDVQAATVRRHPGAGARPAGAVRGGAPVELVGHDVASRPGLRPGAARHRGVRPESGARAR